MKVSLPLHWAMILVALAGCSHGGSVSATADGAAASSTPPVAPPNLMRLAASCGQHEGEWLQGKGCGMTERLCFSTYHGHATWFHGPGCSVDKLRQADICDHEGMQGGTQWACYVKYIPIADWQRMP